MLPLGVCADEDPVAQAFVQRRASLTQEQWDTFLSKKVQPALLAAALPVMRLACAQPALGLITEGCEFHCASCMPSAYLL